MTTYVTQGTATGGFVGELIPEIAAELSSGVLVSREAVEEEIDLMLRTVRSFWDMEPDQVMQTCALLSARSTELSVHLHRLETQRQWKQVRTMQVERLLLELDRQFRIASRMLEVRRQDLELSR